MERWFWCHPRCAQPPDRLASFNGPPDAEDTVEISYGIAPAYADRGYATEAARLLIAHATSSGQVGTVRAYTLPERNASTRVLEKCGFQHRGAVNHPEDGLIWLLGVAGAVDRRDLLRNVTQSQIDRE